VCLSPWLAEEEAVVGVEAPQPGPAGGAGPGGGQALGQAPPTEHVAAHGGEHTPSPLSDGGEGVEADGAGEGGEGGGGR